MTSNSKPISTQFNLSAQRLMVKITQKLGHPWSAILSVIDYLIKSSHSGKGLSKGFHTAQLKKKLA